MRITFLLHGHPYTDHTSLAAYHKCQALLSLGHEIALVFFDSDAIYHANNFSVTPQDEWDASAAWLALSEQYGFPLHVCTTSATHRGVITEEQATFYNKPGANWKAGYTPSGLGQFFEALHQSDALEEF